MNTNKGMKDAPKIWNDTEVKILKKWGEQAASYRVLHNRAYRKYKHLTALFTIPVIVISTLTGTANFSQGTIIQLYPSVDLYLPLVIGALNLISGIITTIGQFLRVSELNEANRNASISYGKFARNISTELSLPPNERTYSGLDFIQICRNEMDRLIEQSPEISMTIINKFENNKKFKHIIKPELININEIKVYEPTTREITSDIVADAAGKFRNRFLKSKLKELEPKKDSSSKFNEFTAKRNVQLELEELRDNKVANKTDVKSKVSSLFENNENVKNHNITSKIKNNNTTSNVKDVKNLFEQNAFSNYETPPKRHKIIRSTIGFTDYDNLEQIKNQQNNDDSKSHVSINVNKLKTDLLDKIDETKKNIDNNLNTNVDISEIETNLDEINNVIINTTQNNKNIDDIISIENNTNQNTEEINTEEINTEEINTEEINTEEINTEEINTEEINTEEINTKENKLDVNNDETEHTEDEQL